METVIGHGAQKQALWNNPKVATWLLCGKRGVGKSSVAKAFARYVTNSQTLLASPDVMIVEDESSPISIDRIREIRGFLHMTAFNSAKKIVIIDGIDDLSPCATNALLKTLEEPPGDSHILLISHNLYCVPMIIKSRCVILRFSELSREETERVVESILPNPEMRDMAISLYLGTPGLVTEDINKEISVYEHFSSVIKGDDFTAHCEVLKTDLSMHKIEYMALKAVANFVFCILKNRKDSCFDKNFVVLQNILEKYFTIQRIFGTSRKLNLHREVTIFRVLETMAHFSVLSKHRALS